MIRKKITSLIILLAVSAVIIILAIKSSTPTSFIVDGENFSAEINGGELVLSLPSNPSTGYSWIVTEESDIFSKESENYINDSNAAGLVGAGGTTQLHFVAQAEGSGTATLRYAQNWSGGMIDSTYQLEVTISKHATGLQFDQVTWNKMD